MIIEGNEKEIEAMEQFHKGNRQEGLRLQEEFAAAFREEYKDKDHCPCKKACRYHGNCKECVAIHRAHQEHVPNCMRPIINAKIKLLSELTEHTIAEEIEAPHEILFFRFRVTDFITVAGEANPPALAVGSVKTAVRENRSCFIIAARENRSC